MRLFGASFFVCKAIIWLPIAIYVPALTFSSVSGLSVHTITPMVIVICTFYTTVGGIKGVVWTDVIQSFIMYGSLLILMIKGTIDIGGLGVLWQRNMDGGRLNFPVPTLDPTVRMSILSVFLGGTFLKLQNTSIIQPTIQRFMSLPSLKHIKQSLFTFSIGLILLLLCCIYVGLVCYAYYHDCDPITTGLAERSDQLVPVLVMDILGVLPGVPGLFVSAVFSAALSSISTLLNSLSAVILEDFVRPSVRQPLSERATAFIMRLIVVVFGISSLALVFLVEKMGMLLQLSDSVQSVIYGPMLGIFSVGMLMPWVNEKSVLSGCLVSFLIMIYICASAQIANYTSSFKHIKLPISVDGCDYNFNMSYYTNSTEKDQPIVKGSSITHISFLLYTALGALLTMICSNIAILFFGRNDIRQIDERLIAPCLLRYLRKHNYYQTVEMKERLAVDQESLD